MLYFKLEEIKSDHDLMKIITKIKYSLSKIQNPVNKIMVVSLHEISDDDNTMIPKLEYKNI